MVEIVNLAEEKGLALLARGIVCLRFGKFDEARAQIEPAHHIFKCIRADEDYIKTCSDFLDYIERAA